MDMNEGLTGRFPRGAAGIALLSLAPAGPRTPGGHPGIAPLLAGLSGFFPLCHAPVISVCRTCGEQSGKGGPA